MTRQQKILSFMQRPGYKPLKFDELAKALNIPKKDLHLLSGALDELLCNGIIVKNKRGRYDLSSNAGLITGRFRASSASGGFVVPDDGSEDIYICKDGCLGAMNGDTVMVRIRKKASQNRKREGEVKRIIKRFHETVIGSFYIDRLGRYMLLPNDPKLNISIYLSKEGCSTLSENDKIIAKITHWPKKNTSAKAQFIEFLGPADDPATDTTCILRQFGIPEEFSPATILQAESLDTEVLPKQLEGRKDFRGDNIITIDGEDAKDFDDAVCVKRLAGGGYRLFVHIADVSYYVGENTAIDMEAFERATSVYFPDRVVPMLPEKLSNGICSLNPNVDRLTLSVIIDIDRSGNVLDYEICEGVIRSVERMTYTDVTALLEQDVPHLKARYAHILQDIQAMSELASLLRKKRMARGAIDFDIPETKVVLDEQGHIKDVIRYTPGVSNRIIEEFMLICNEVVAKHAFLEGLPFIYRVHKPPDEAKISELIRFLYNIGIDFKPPKKITPMQMQTLLEKVKGSTLERVINTMALRSMPKARYAAQNLGHFGLSSGYYCHFTAPIRRYPDLVIHRIIKENLKKGFSEKRLKYLTIFAEEAAKHSSDMEIRAMEAEREAVKLKVCEFMRQFEGQEFDAVISSVTEFGLFVELDNTAEGLISLRDLQDDFYIYDKESYSIIGEHNKKRYSIGDAIRVRLVRSDPASRQIDFVPADQSITGSPELLVLSKSRSFSKADKRLKIS